MTAQRWLRELTAVQLDLMRGWLLDCGWCELDWVLPDEEVVRTVAREYVGGVPQFLADSVMADAADVADDELKWEG